MTFLVIDLKHKSKKGPFFHHIGISAFIEVQLKGLKLAFKVKFGDQGDSIVDELTSGWYVHFLRSVKRMVTSLPIESDYIDVVSA